MTDAENPNRAVNTAVDGFEESSVGFVSDFVL